MAGHEIDMSAFEELKQTSGADFITELIDAFLEEAPKLIEELRSALQEGDSETFRRAAHSLKSNSATFGASRLSELAQELEVIGRQKRLGEVQGRIEVLESRYGDVASELKGLRE